MNKHPSRPSHPQQAEAGAAHAVPAPDGYATLTPDVVLDALDSVGLRGDGRIQALGSYENRVILAELDEPFCGNTSVVLKFYRPGRWAEAQILEEHAFAAELMADEVPVIGPLVLQGHTLHHFAGFAFSASPRRGGRRPELEDPEVLEWIGRFLGRIHSVGERSPFRHRLSLDIERYAVEPRSWLLANEAVPLDVRSDWDAACQRAIALMQAHALMLPSSDIQRLRLHGDCHPGNILWTPQDAPGAGPHFVDLDDACTGPAVQDLWMLLSGDRQQQTFALSCLLEGYEQFRPFDRRELALLEVLRTLRLIHYSAWLARRWSDPSFPVHFPWFGSSDYWQGQVATLHEQIEAMQAEPLSA